MHSHQAPRSPDERDSPALTGQARRKLDRAARARREQIPAEGPVTAAGQMKAGRGAPRGTPRRGRRPGGPGALERLRALIGPFKALLARLTRGWYPRRASGPEAVARDVAVLTGLLEKPRKTPADYRAIELQVRALGARVHEGGALEGLVTVMNREEVWRKPPLLALVLAQIERGAPALPLRDALETLTARLPTYV
ncbi:MAG: hypothetical protein HYY85_03895, partial [Deltaproteobacteria bacterium]|nr:hypothetical protein [Deltaproteobacteria bacterium]